MIFGRRRRRLPGVLLDAIERDLAVDVPHADRLRVRAVETHVDFATGEVDVVVTLRGRDPHGPIHPNCVMQLVPIPEPVEPPAA